MVNKINHLLLTLEKVREDQVLNLVEDDFLRRRKTLSHIRWFNCDKKGHYDKTVLRNQVTIIKVRTRVSSKAKVRENIMHMQQMTMSIRKRDLG